MMRKHLTTVLAATLILAAPHAALADSGTPAAGDYRLKTVVYNRDESVRIDSVVGLATHIEMAPNERYQTHVFGDPDAWELGHMKNHIFIKPKQADGDTNLTIVMDTGNGDRTYHLLIHYIGDRHVSVSGGGTIRRPIRTPWAMKQATVELRYVYPMDDAAKRVAAVEKQRVQQALSATLGTAGAYNTAYVMSDSPASRSIAPMNAWDDYQFTYFKFPANIDLPQIFVVRPDGSEGTVNVNVLGAAGNIIQAQMVSKQWRIRSGKQVVGVRNNGYDPSRGANTTGTSVQNVRRVQKSATSEGGTK